MKRDLIIYRVVTGLLSLMMLGSAGMYIMNHDAISEAFVKLGYPTYIIYPLAIAKILGLVAIWTKKSNTLKEWAYAGFFFDFVLAAAAHISIQDGEHLGAIVATIMLLVSYFYDQRLYDREGNLKE